MKKLFVLCLIITSFTVKAQTPVSVVNDPKANVTLSILETINKDIDIAIKKTQNATQELSTFQKLKNDAAKVVSTLATVKIITQLLMDLSCQMKELSSSVSIVDQMNNCDFKLNYNLMLMKLQGATDLIKVAVVGGNAYLALNEKTDALTKVMTTLENSIKDMQKINSQIRYSALKMLQTKYSTTPNYKGLIATQR